MGAILSPAIDAIRKIDPAPSLRAWHGPNGGECPNTLDTLPVLVRYELTHDRCGSEIAEVVEVSISGHTLSAGNFDVSLCAEWGRQCMQLRGGL